ncbi:MAG: hypothetical protein JWO98_4864, partial [Frankiales bacterium]|nr:hypothetical protein [Frankiales bacterium]
GGADAHGWAPNRDKAAQRANAAAVKLAAGQYATIRIRDYVAETKLAAVTAAPQADAKTKAKTRTTADDDGPALGFLYAIESGYYDYSVREWIHAKVVRLPVTKRTARRIFYSRSSEPAEYETGYVDRQQFEAQGWVWSSRYSKIYAELPELVEPPITIRPPRPAPSYIPDLKQLKAEMAAAHPDRGGTNEAFIAAHEKYQRARRMAGR